MVMTVAHACECSVLGCVSGVCKLFSQAWHMVMTGPNIGINACKSVPTGSCLHPHHIQNLKGYLSTTLMSQQEHNLLQV